MTSYDITWMEDTGETPYDRLRRREAWLYEKYEHDLNESDYDEE